VCEDVCELKSERGGGGLSFFFGGGGGGGRWGYFLYQSTDLYNVHQTYMSRVIFSKMCPQKVFLPDSRISAVGSCVSEATCHVMAWHVMSCLVFTFKTRAWWGDTVVATFL